MESINVKVPLVWYRNKVSSVLAFMSTPLSVQKPLHVLPHFFHPSVKMCSNKWLMPDVSLVSLMNPALMAHSTLMMGFGVGCKMIL
jgi:hypothetical protein